MINSGVNPWPAVRRHTTGVYGQSAGLILLAAILMGPAFWQGGIYAALDIMSVTLPWAETLGRKPFYNPLIVDPAVQYLPWRNFAYETIRGGQWPLWNPYIFSGHPTFGSINEQIFYPPNFLVAFLPAERGFGWLTLFHLRRVMWIDNKGTPWQRRSVQPLPTTEFLPHVANVRSVCPCVRVRR